MASSSSHRPPPLIPAGLPAVSWPYEPKPGDPCIVSSSVAHWAQSTAADIRNHDKERWLEANGKSNPEDFWSAAWIEHRGREYAEEVLKYIVLQNTEEIGGIALLTISDMCAYKPGHFTRVMYEQLDTPTMIKLFFSNEKQQKHGWPVLAKVIGWFQMSYKAYRNNMGALEQMSRVRITMPLLKSMGIVPPERPEDQGLPGDYYAEGLMNALGYNPYALMNASQAIKFPAARSQRNVQSTFPSQGASSHPAMNSNADDTMPNGALRKPVFEQLVEQAEARLRGGDGGVLVHLPTNEMPSTNHEQGSPETTVFMSPKGKKEGWGNENETPKVSRGFLHRRVKSATEAASYHHGFVDTSRTELLAESAVERRAVSTESQSQILVTAAAKSDLPNLPIHGRGGARFATSGQYQYQPVVSVPKLDVSHGPSSLAANDLDDNKHQTHVGRQLPPRPLPYYPANRQGSNHGLPDPRKTRSFVPANQQPYRSPHYLPSPSAQHPPPAGDFRGPRSRKNDNSRHFSTASTPMGVHNLPHHSQPRQVSSTMMSAAPPGLNVVQTMAQSPRGTSYPVFVDTLTGQYVPPPTSSPTYGHRYGLQQPGPLWSPYSATSDFAQGSLDRPNQRHASAMNPRAGIEQQIGSARNPSNATGRGGRRQNMRADPALFIPQDGGRPSPMYGAQPFQPPNMMRRASGPMLKSAHSDGPNVSMVRQQPHQSGVPKAPTSSGKERFPDYRDDTNDMQFLDKTEECGKGFIGPKANDVVTLWVGDIPVHTSVAELKEFFNEKLPVERMKDITYDARANLGRGWTFIDFASNADAREALRLFRDCPFKGEMLKIQVPERRCSDARSRQYSRSGHGGFNPFASPRSAHQASISENNMSIHFRGPSDTRSSRVESMSQAGTAIRRNSFFTQQDARSDLPLPFLPELAENISVVVSPEEGELNDPAILRLEPPPKSAKKRFKKKNKSKSRDFSFPSSESNLALDRDASHDQICHMEEKSQGVNQSLISQAANPRAASFAPEHSQNPSLSIDGAPVCDSASLSLEAVSSVTGCLQHGQTREDDNIEVSKEHGNLAGGEVVLAVGEGAQASVDSDHHSFDGPQPIQGEFVVEMSQEQNLAMARYEQGLGTSAIIPDPPVSEAGVSTTSGTSKSAARKGAAVTESLSIFSKKVLTTTAVASKKQTKNQKKGTKKSSRNVSSGSISFNRSAEPEVLSLAEIKAREKAKLSTHEVRQTASSQNSEEHLDTTDISGDNISEVSDGAVIRTIIDATKVDSVVEGTERSFSLSMLSESSFMDGTPRTAREYQTPPPFMPTPKTFPESTTEVAPAEAEAGEDTTVKDPAVQDSAMTDPLEEIVSQKKARKKKPKRRKSVKVDGKEDTINEEEDEEVSGPISCDETTTRERSTSLLQGKISPGHPTNGGRNPIDPCEQLQETGSEIFRETAQQKENGCKSLAPISYAQAAKVVTNANDFMPLVGLSERDVNVEKKVG